MTRSCAASGSRSPRGRWSRSPAARRPTARGAGRRQGVRVREPVAVHGLTHVGPRPAQGCAPWAPGRPSRSAPGAQEGAPPLGRPEAVELLPRSRRRRGCGPARRPRPAPRPRSTRPLRGPRRAAPRARRSLAGRGGRPASRSGRRPPRRPGRARRRGPRRGRRRGRRSRRSRGRRRRPPGGCARGPLPRRSRRRPCDG